jgi:hypothetical protein
LTPRTIRRRLAYHIVRAQTQLLAAQFSRDGVVEPVLGGTITIRDEDGTAIVNAEAIVPSGTDATYLLDAATVPASLDYSCNWSVDWAPTFSAAPTPQTFSMDAFLLRRSMPMVIDGEDLVGERGWHPELSADQVLTVPQAHNFVVLAFYDIHGWLVEDGHPPHKALSPTGTFAEMHASWSAHRMFAHLATYATGQGGRYVSERDRYGKAAKDNYARLRLKQDADQDGTPDGTTANFEPLYGVQDNIRGAVTA